MDTNIYLNDITDLPLSSTSSSSFNVNLNLKNDIDHQREIQLLDQQEDHQQVNILHKNILEGDNYNIINEKDDNEDVAEVEHHQQEDIMIKTANSSPIDDSQQHLLFQQLFHEQNPLNSSMSSILGGHSFSQYAPIGSQAEETDNILSQGQMQTENYLDNVESTAHQLNSINMSLDSNVNHATRQSMETGYSYDISPFNSNPGLLYHQNTFNSGAMSMASLFNSNSSTNSHFTSIHSNKNLNNNSQQQQQQFYNYLNNPHRELYPRPSIDRYYTNQLLDTNELVFRSHQDFQYQGNTIEAINNINSCNKLMLGKGEREEEEADEEEGLQFKKSSTQQLQLQSGDTTSNPNVQEKSTPTTSFNTYSTMQSQKTANHNIPSSSNDIPQAQLDNPKINFISSSQQSTNNYHHHLPFTETDIPDQPAFKKYRSNSMNSSSFDGDSLDSASLEKSLLSTTTRNTYRCSHCGAEKRKHKCLVKEMLFKREVGCQVDACLTTATEPTTPTPPFKIIGVRKSCPVEQIVQSLGFELPPRIPTCLPEVLQSAASFEDPVGIPSNISSLLSSFGTAIQRDTNHHHNSFLFSNTNNNVDDNNEDVVVQQILQFTAEQRQQLAYEEEQKKQLQLLLQAHLANLSFDNQSEDPNQLS